MLPPPVLPYPGRAGEPAAYCGTSSALRLTPPLPCGGEERIGERPTYSPGHTQVTIEPSGRERASCGRN